MIRRLMLSIAATSLAAAMLPALAVAGDPVGGCPTGADWFLVLPIHQPQAMDHNGDGWLCRLNLPSGQGGVLAGGFTFHDNDVPDGGQ